MSYGQEISFSILGDHFCDNMIAIDMGDPAEVLERMEEEAAQFIATYGNKRWTLPEQRAWVKRIVRAALR